MTEHRPDRTASSNPDVGWRTVNDVRRHARRRPAFTIAELIISLVITALIASSVASVLYAAGYGTSSRRDVRRVVVRSQQIHRRVDDAVRNAAAVLAGGSGYVVLWTGDSRDDNQVNLSELQLIELVGSTLTAYSADFPDGWTDAQIEAADTAYPPASNFATVAQTEKAGSYFPATEWATQISDFELTLDDPTPVDARLVTWKLTLTHELLSEDLVGTASLRAPLTPQ